MKNRFPFSLKSSIKIFRKRKREREWTDNIYRSYRMYFSHENPKDFTALQRENSTQHRKLLRHWKYSVCFSPLRSPQLGLYLTAYARARETLTSSQAPMPKFKSLLYRFSINSCSRMFAIHVHRPVNNISRKHLQRREPSFPPPALIGEIHPPPGKYQNSRLKIAFSATLKLCLKFDYVLVSDVRAIIRVESVKSINGRFVHRSKKRDWMFRKQRWN